MALAGAARLCSGMDTDMRAAFHELLTAMETGFSRLEGRPEELKEVPTEGRADRLRDIRWELATLKNRAAAAKNELAAIQHTLAILENRLKEMERQEVA